MENKIKIHYKQLEALNNQRKHHQTQRMKIRQVSQRKQFQKQHRSN